MKDFNVTLAVELLKQSKKWVVESKATNLEQMWILSNLNNVIELIEHKESEDKNNG